MSTTRFCISHTDGTDNWVLKEWVPVPKRVLWGGSFWWRSGEWRLVDTFPSEAAAKTKMKQLATALTNTAYYDQYGEMHYYG